MHERRRPERRFARIAEIQICGQIAPEFLREAQRNLIKQIVRMLAVVERIALPGLAGLKEKRVAASTFGQQIEAHHSAKTELGALSERMRIHRHKPVWRVDPIVAAACAGVDVTRKNSSMQHEHVVAEHQHASIHRCRVRHPARPGTLAAHRLRDVHG